MEMEIAFSIQLHVAYIQQLSRADNAQALTILRTASNNSTNAMELLVSHLRQFEVSDWMEPNSDRYQISSTQLLAEAPRFDHMYTMHYRYYRHYTGTTGTTRMYYMYTTGTMHTTMQALYTCRYYMYL